MIMANPQTANKQRFKSKNYKLVTFEVLVLLFSWYKVLICVRVALRSASAFLIWKSAKCGIVI